ncbi:hypothetical protein BC831DRAFT_441682 [Entophlyctis helioformis]|nr:hypothetical protein BC831DRAFT_441682 [Entophlyctis helioformis]
MARLHNAARVIQRHVRGHLVRRRLLMSAHMRLRRQSNQLRTDIHARDEAIARNTRRLDMYRGLHASRVRMYEMQSVVSAVVRVQSWWRGHCHRRALATQSPAVHARLRRLRSLSRSRSRSTSPARRKSPSPCRHLVQETGVQGTPAKHPSPDQVARAVSAIITSMRSHAAMPRSTHESRDELVAQFRRLDVSLGSFYEQDREPASRMDACRDRRTRLEALLARMQEMGNKGLDSAPYMLEQPVLLGPETLSRYRHSYLTEHRHARKAWWDRVPVLLGNSNAGNGDGQSVGMGRDARATERTGGRTGRLSSPERIEKHKAVRRRLDQLELENWIAEISRDLPADGSSDSNTIF